MQKIPQELVDNIVENALQANDRSAMQCSLVCRKWLPATRRHLFSNVELKRVGLPAGSYSDRAWRSRRFLQMLDAESCTFAPFVTRLSLDCMDAASAEVDSAFQTLSKLTAVKELQLNVWGLWFGVQPLQDWLSCLKNLTQLTLNRVHFERTSQLFSVLERCSSLTELEITSSTWATEQDYEGQKELHRNPRSILKER
jgi:hypothetical protein